VECGVLNAATMPPVDEIDLFTSRYLNERLAEVDLELIDGLAIASARE
jgi:hypothetical protein